MIAIDRKLIVYKRELSRYLNKFPDSPYSSAGRVLRSRLEYDHKWYRRHFNLIDACYPYQWSIILTLE